MNPEVTSKEAILRVCRGIVSAQGLSALSMRAVAGELGIALGTLYNYFPGKDALLLATVESVWQDIFHRQEESETPLPFPDYTQALFFRIRRGAEAYPNFLTTHSLSIAKSKRDAAKGAMEQCFAHIKAGLLEALRADPNVDPAAFCSGLTEKDFADFVMDQLLLLLGKESPDPAPLLALLRRVLYR